MPEIPGTPQVPGQLPQQRRSVAGRGGLNTEGSREAGAAAGVPGSSTQNAAANVPAKRYFGFHNDASLLARLGAMGVSPTLEHLRIAKELLRYGQGIDGDAIAQIAKQWSELGFPDPNYLEAIVLAYSQGIRMNPGAIDALLQLLSGGPFTHLLARLTMALKAEPNTKMLGLGRKLTAFWQLGKLEQKPVQQLPQFQGLLSGMAEELSRLEARGLGSETALELQRLKQLFEGQKLLANAGNPVQIFPFFIWRDAQPLPGEVLVQQEGGGQHGVATAFVRVTLAIDTRHLGRITVELTFIRGRLTVLIEVPEDTVKKRVEARLALLRQSLAAVPYEVDSISVRTVGPARAISALLPRRRDVRRLSRAEGIL
jgi:hypothetical protein